MFLRHLKAHQSLGRCFISSNSHDLAIAELNKVNVTNSTVFVSCLLKFCISGSFVYLSKYINHQWISSNTGFQILFISLVDFHSLKY